jgi:hypothetical protein
MKIHIPALLAAMILCCCAGPDHPSPLPGANGFDQPEAPGWRTSSTGGSGPEATWALRPDPSARSAPNVLALVDVNHHSEDRFNVHWSATPSFGSGKLSVAVRADGGEIDQGGGLMWRVQDENNYYVCRINPLEANYRVYVVKDGVRRQLATALADVEAGRWYTLEVEHRGDEITCSLDGKALLHATDATIPAAGGVGLWTKADARTSFDDLAIR